MTKKIDLTILSLFIITVSLLTYLSLFNAPTADDYSYANNAISKGFFENIKHYYLTWSGRYSATALLSLSPLVFKNISLYKLLAPLSLIFFICSIYLLLNSLNNRLNLKVSNTVTLTFFIFLVFLNESYSISEFYYWWPGIVNYQVPLSLYLIFISRLIKIQNSPKIIDYLLIFILTGFSETLAFIILIKLFIFSCFSFKKSKKISNKFLPLFLFSICCFLLVVLAPGGAERMKFFPERVTYKAFTKPFESMFKVFFRSIKPTSLALALYISTKYNTNLKIKLSFKKLLIGSIAVIFLLYFPVAFGTGRGGPDRLHTMNYFFMLSAIILFSFNYQNKISDAFSKIPIKATYIFYFLLLTGLATGNFSQLVVKDYVTAPKYYSAFKKRIAIVKDNSKKDLTLPKLSPRARSLFFRDLEKNKNKFQNKAFAKYWGLKSVRIKD